MTPSNKWGAVYFHIVLSIYIHIYLKPPIPPLPRLPPHPSLNSIPNLPPLPPHPSLTYITTLPTLPPFPPLLPPPPLPNPPHPPTLDSILNIVNGNDKSAVIRTNCLHNIITPDIPPHPPDTAGIYFSTLTPLHQLPCDNLHHHFLHRPVPPTNHHTPSSFGTTINPL